METLWKIGDRVQIVASGEVGEVIALAVYANGAEPSALVRYKAADGRAVEVWWTESALGAAAEA